MSNVAFYAPLKPPTHANPSGDRELARALMQALDVAGYTVDLASELRLFDKHGDAQVQAEMRRQADAAKPKLIDTGKRQNWRAWITYHNYYKAPDLLGPDVAQALGIPYLQIESTRARKRLNGPWAAFAQAAEDAADAAHAILYFTQRDHEALASYAPPGQTHVHLHPFLPRIDLPPQSTRSGAILTAAMMRPGDKFESYQLIAQSLKHVTEPWQLDIAGDGKCRAEIEALMAPYGEKVRFLGKLDSAGMAQAYRTAKLLFWPGVNEAIGLTYLEAQAAGIPILAQDRPGLREVLAPDHACPAPEDGPLALAKRLDALLRDPPAGDQIRAHIQSHHLLGAAARTLSDTLGALL